jgi:ADP-ribose pyrophosphatase YjhB (NUDIX family)
MQAPSGSSDDMARVIQAGAIAVRGKKVLIVRAKRSPGDWTFPKGHVEPGESLAETACRELAEEAGVSGRAVRQVGVSTFPRGRLQIDVTYFLVRFVRHVEPSEQREVRWCSLEEARSLVSFADAQRLLDRVEQLQSNS